MVSSAVHIWREAAAVWVWVIGIVHRRRWSTWAIGVGDRRERSTWAPKKAAARRCIGAMRPNLPPVFPR
jgi:hypothetical protein